MPGSFDFDPGSGQPLDVPGARVLVFRYDADSSTYTHLPNVRATDIQYREGPTPPSARFRYVFDDAADSALPRHFEQVYPLDARGRYVVKNDDRIAVLRFRPDGRHEVLFDGFASVPQVDIGPEEQSVTFQATDVSVRCWDDPLGGAFMRNADDPEDPEGDRETDLPSRFNPDGEPNSTPDEVGADAGELGKEYPVFLDPNVARLPEVRRKWTLGMAARYVMWRGNADEEYVLNVDSDLVDELLESRREKDGAPYYDPDDPDTFDAKPILVHDFDCTGHPWPEALHEIIKPHGFEMAFRCLTGDDGLPVHDLYLYRKDRKVKPKPLLLQPYGEALDPGKSNVGTLRLERDAHSVANRWIVDGRPTRYEASFVLAPGTLVASIDATVENRQKFIKGHVDTSTGLTDFVPDFYRLFIFDETGEGHWDFATSAMVETAAGLARVLGGESEDADAYVRRRRPPVKSLVTDDGDIPRKAELHLSRDYAGPVPGVWDRSGTWQQITGGGWDTLDDRLGIEITATDPNGWSIWKPGNSSIIASGIARVVECMATPSLGNGCPRFFLRLTCVIEGDRSLSRDAIAGLRVSSPTKFSITRRDDERDRYQKQVISKYSHLSDGVADAAGRDDTEDAFAHASAKRAAHERLRFSGSVTIPKFTAAYQVGDKVDRIDGRDVSLRTNLGADEDEAPQYPTVVSVSWSFGDRQTTSLDLDDEVLPPPPRRQS